MATERLITSLPGLVPVRRFRGPRNDLVLEQIRNHLPVVFILGQHGEEVLERLREVRGDRTAALSVVARRLSR